MRAQYLVEEHIVIVISHHTVRGVVGVAQIENKETTIVPKRKKPEGNGGEFRTPDLTSRKQ